AGRRHQSEWDDHRHEPHRRSRARTRRVGGRDREPPEQRPRREVGRRAVHVGRTRRRDERGVDQGVLLADRGGGASPPPRRGPAIATEAGPTAAARHHDLLAALRELPDRMLEVIATREAIAGVAQRHAPSKRYWAVVGNGANRIAASELRIKLSELCYKSIA